MSAVPCQNTDSYQATDTIQLIRASAPNDAFVKSEVEKSQYWVRIAYVSLGAARFAIGLFDST